MTTLYVRGTHSSLDIAACANCNWRGGAAQLNDIKHYHERVDPKDECEPDGECPECGCLAYVE